MLVIDEYISDNWDSFNKKVSIHRIALLPPYVRHAPHHCRSLLCRSASLRLPHRCFIIAMHAGDWEGYIAEHGAAGLAQLLRTSRRPPTMCFAGIVCLAD